MNMLDSVRSMARTAVREKRDLSDDGSRSWKTNATHQPGYGGDEVCQRLLDYWQQVKDHVCRWYPDAVHDTKNHRVRSKPKFGRVSKYVGHRAYHKNTSTPNGFKAKKAKRNIICR